jgi:hypothetical protein
MHNLIRRVIAPLRRHLLLIYGALFLLAVVVVWWIFSAPIAPWLHSAQSVDVVTLLQQHLLAAGMIGGCLLILVLIGLPKWQASRVQDVKDRLTVENAARQTLAQIIGGAVLIAGLFFTWANIELLIPNCRIFPQNRHVRQHPCSCRTAGSTLCTSECAQDHRPAGTLLVSLQGTAPGKGGQIPWHWHGGIRCEM